VTGKEVARRPVLAVGDDRCCFDHRILFMALEKRKEAVRLVDDPRCVPNCSDQARGIDRAVCLVTKPGVPVCTDERGIRIGRGEVLPVDRRKGMAVKSAGELRAGLEKLDSDISGMAALK
jgi:hypothetical protein